MLVQPTNLSPTTHFAIDQFVMRGGRALVFVDPNSEFESQRGGMMQAAGTGSDLPRLFQAWGIEMVENRVAADRQAAIRVSTGSADTRVRAVDYVAWLQLRQANCNTSDVLTANHGNVRVASAGILKRLGAPTCIVVTSPQQMDRAIDLFAHEGIKALPLYVTSVPWSLGGDARWWEWLMPSTAARAVSRDVIYERMAWPYYRVRGWVG